ncbi:hypothetical protein L1887_20238 [Cichorium endivia]|nr:hypothetical protein L1887_20238 [Cichorium endivia]
MFMTLFCSIDPFKLRPANIKLAERILVYTFQIRVHSSPLRNLCSKLCMPTVCCYVSMLTCSAVYMSSLSMIIISI